MKQYRTEEKDSDYNNVGRMKEKGEEGEREIFFPVSKISQNSYLESGENFRYI